jgi:flagellar biosynthesis/type III secretory pathway protein FliH
VIEIKRDEDFAEAARVWLKVEPKDYYFEEYLSGLDHGDDGVSISDTVRFFYDSGRDHGYEDGVKAMLEEANPIVLRLRDTIEKLQAENERLREALQTIADADTCKAEDILAKLKEQGDD